MITVKTHLAIADDGFETNTYIVTCEETGDTLVVDPSLPEEKLIEKLKDKNVKYVLLTHGHFDHAATAKKFQDDGIKIYIHKYDADKLYTENNLAKHFGYTFENLVSDFTFTEGELIIDNFKLEVLHTPGHSKGSVCFIYKNHLFTGDTIFENGYGRVDLYDGDFFEIKQSIKKLMPYKKSGYLLHYGH